jgi:type VI secretion system protein VasG
MLRGLKEKYEKHHGVQRPHPPLWMAAGNPHSIRKVAALGCNLLLDQFQSPAQIKERIALYRSAVEAEGRVFDPLMVAVARNAMATDAKRGVPVDVEAQKKLEEETQQLETRKSDLEARWVKEKVLVEKIHELRRRHAEAAEGNGAGIDEIEAARKELAVLQGDSPLVHAEVGPEVAAQVVAEWTGIPAGKMAQDDVAALLELESRMAQRVLGQDHALKEIGDTIRISKAGMRDARNPIGVFLLVGPSGTGKTETALSLADLLFGGERFLTTINMSEYQEPHTVSQLKGSPPGYVGYGEGGVLTEAVRQRPYSVVLLDEVEKAHRDVLNLFYQVFDKGFMRDGEGREIDFKNTVIVMTSNLATDAIMEACTGEGERPAPHELRDVIREDLIRHFQPALVARMKVIPYYPIDPETMERIVRLKLDRVGERLRQAHRMELVYDDRLVTTIAARCTEIETGARNVDAIVERSILPDLSAALVRRLTEEKAPKGLSLEFDAEGNFSYRFIEAEEALAAPAPTPAA